MKKILFSFLALAMSFSIAVAQSIDEGIQAVYYSKFNTAKNIFQQIVNKEPGNTQAIYWLGQTMIQNLAMPDGPQQARALYEKALAANPSDPWLLVGMGNTDYLVTKDKNAAKQRFEQAIKITSDKSKKRDKGKNLAEIYTAIGRASSHGDGDQGDPAYVIPLLEQAMQLDDSNPYSGIYLGMNYLKQGGENGGKAYQAYNTAFTRNPGFALAPYRIGVMYQSQANYQAMNEWYQKAISADPNFAAPYLTYFEYFRENDVNKAKEFLDQFVRVAEQSCDTKYFQADFSYVSGKYQEAINQAQQMLNSECRSYPDVNMLLAKSYHRLGQSDKAAAAVDAYFKVAPASSIHGQDYASAGYILKEDSTKAMRAVEYLKKAYEMDTAVYLRERYIDSISVAYDKANKPAEKFQWLKGIYAGKKISDKGMVSYADAAFKAGQYKLSDSLYTILKSKYPEDMFAYYYLQQSALAQDSTKELALPHIKNFIAYLEPRINEASNKQTLIYEYYLLGDYYANTKKDYANARDYFAKIVALDPENAGAKQAVEQLNNMLKGKK